MNKDDVKEKLQIPSEHYLATVTPLGYPANRQIPTPGRNELDHFIRT
jgi:hypothetical protein